MVGCACLALAGRLLNLSIITWLRCPVRLPLRVRMRLFLCHKLKLVTPARSVRIKNVTLGAGWSHVSPLVVTTYGKKIFLFRCRGPAPRDVSPLVVTTYGEKIFTYIAHPMITESFFAR